MFRPNKSPMSSELMGLLNLRKFLGSNNDLLAGTTCANCIDPKPDTFDAVEVIGVVVMAGSLVLVHHFWPPHF